VIGEDLDTTISRALYPYDSQISRISFAESKVVRGFMTAAFAGGVPTPTSSQDKCFPLLEFISTSASPFIYDVSSCITGD
jgi:hypothetical protein